MALNMNFADSLIASRVSDDAFLSCYRLIRFCVSSSCLHNVLRNFTVQTTKYHGVCGSWKLALLAGVAVTSPKTERDFQGSLMPHAVV